jgi:hypothetical protein
MLVDDEIIAFTPPGGAGQHDAPCSGMLQLAWQEGFHTEGKCAILTDGYRVSVYEIRFHRHEL